jgi:hypothetical protein
MLNNVSPQLAHRRLSGVIAGPHYAFGTEGIDCAGQS